MDPRRLAAIVSPELVAALLVLLVLPIGVVALGGPRTATPSPSPSPRPSEAPGATPAPEIRTLRLLAQLNERVLETGRRVELILAETEPSGARIADALRQLNAALREAEQPAGEIAERRPTAELGNALLAAYEGLRDLIATALQAPLADHESYRAAAREAVTALPEIERLGERIEAALRLAATTPSPTPGASRPPQAPSPSPAGPSPGSAAPSGAPPAGGAESVVNGGFEAGSVAPWQLETDEIAPSSSLTLDRDVRASGTASARVDPGDDPGRLVLRQSRLLLWPGTYRVTAALLAANEEHVSIRIVGGDGRLLRSQDATVGPRWTTVGFELTTIVGDASARIELDLGRPSGPIWVDDVSVRPLE